MTAQGWIAIGLVWLALQPLVVLAVYRFTSHAGARRT
jgi:hypothetical protein